MSYSDQYSGPDHNRVVLYGETTTSRTIKNIENDILEIEKKLNDPNCRNRSGKLQTIELAKKTIEDLKNERE